MKIKTASIRGLWGYRNIDIDFYSDVNFLIGVNGSGKTAVINLLAAALRADFPTLDRLSFKQIKVELMRRKNDKSEEKRSPTILVEKIDKDDSPYNDIRYTITFETGKVQEYSLSDLEDERQYRVYPIRHRHQQLHRDVSELLNTLIHVNWLSIHRTTSSRFFREDREERSFESTIDKKLDQQSRELSKYLSVLSSADKHETERFQKEIFLSLIPAGIEQMFDSAQVIDFAADKRALNQIFESFQISPSDASLLDRFFQIIEDSHANPREELSGEQLTVLSSALRIHRVVSEWHELLKKRAEIFDRRNTFLSVINGLLRGKQIELTDKNEAVARIRREKVNKVVQLTELSSGEKQLIIILLEALLNQKKDWVYLADEPELSLHVNWQALLVESVIKINKNAQLVFATHSPDIVSVYGSRVFRMDET